MKTSVPNWLKSKDKSEEIDIRKKGYNSWKELQEANRSYNTDTEPSRVDKLLRDRGITGERVSMYDPLFWAEQDVHSPLVKNRTRLGGRDYWGNSTFDSDFANAYQFQHLGDERANNQPWYSKIINGTAKAGVTALTTVAETGALLFGAATSPFAKSANGNSFMENLWNNPMSQVLKYLNDAAEEFMPNYYTEEEQENPFSNIFSANFIADKLVKNMGFMVGAFYGGTSFSELLGKAGTSAVKRARNSTAALMQGAGKRFSELTQNYGDDVLAEVSRYEKAMRGLKGSDAAKVAANYSDDAKNLFKTLSKEGLTEGERGALMLQGLDRINKIANTTRATTQAIGSFASAANEAGIEAINNSSDWANSEKMEAEAEYEGTIEEIENRYAGDKSVEYFKELEDARNNYMRRLAEIEYGKATVGNVDFLENFPILMFSNMVTLGKLYTRGFDTTKRGLAKFGRGVKNTRRTMGSIWNSHKLPGELAEGTMHTSKTKLKGALTSFAKVNTEGLEEYLQNVASDSAGEAVSDSIDRFLNSGKSGHAETDALDFVTGFGKSMIKNLSNASALEEYFIGALSAAVGMPVFGSQTKNAYGFMKNNGVFGFAGGLVGNYQDYSAAMRHEDKIAKYLNGRVKDPNFRRLYDNLKIHMDYDKWIEEELEKGDKSKYKDLQLELFYEDLNAAASSGHLEEFKELVGFNKDYTKEELKDIVDNTTIKVTPEEQRENDEISLQIIDAELAQIEQAKKEGKKVPSASDIQALKDEKEAITNRIKQDDESKSKKNNGVVSPYTGDQYGPFINSNGRMDEKDPEHMRAILERNRQNFLQGIDEYLKIRDQIDIETDGRLDDDKIAILTRMRGQLLDYDKRSAEMADHLISNLGKPFEYYSNKLEERRKSIEPLQKRYNEAKDELSELKKNKADSKDIEKATKKYNDAYTKLSNANAGLKREEEAVEVLKLLYEEEIPMSARERASYAKGEGEGFFGRMAARFTPSKKRAVNTEEVQHLLANPKNLDEISQNAKALVHYIALTPDIEEATRNKMYSEVVDLARLANKKIAYNKAVREYLGDPSLLNEAFKENADKLSKKEKQNKIDEFALSIQQASSFKELDTIIKNIYNYDREVAREAIAKAKKDSDETTRKFIEEYEEARRFYEDFSTQAFNLRYSPDTAVSTIVGNTAEEEWENCLENATDLKQEFIDGMQANADAARETSNIPNVLQAADTIEKILSSLTNTEKELSTNKSVKDLRAPKELKEEKSSKSTSIEEGEEGEVGFGDKKPEKKPIVKRDPVTSESLIKDIKKEIRNSIKTTKDGIDLSKIIKDFDGLSKDLQDKIKNYNISHPDEQLKVDYSTLGQEVVDSLIAEDGNILGAEGNDGEQIESTEYSPSEVRNEMKQGLKGNYKSDGITQFKIEEGDHPIQYRKEFEPKGEKEATQIASSIQEILKNFRAYQFVDKNYLGYIFRKKQNSNDDLPIYFLEYSDPLFSADPVIFMAIELNNENRGAIAARNGHYEDTNNICPVGIGNKEYQIVGVLSADKNANDDIQKGVENLRKAIHSELEDKLKDKASNSSEESNDANRFNDPNKFVVSEKHESRVVNVFTGRIDLGDSENETNIKVSLCSYMQSNGKNGRQKSTEFDSQDTEWHFLINSGNGVVGKMANNDDVVLPTNLGAKGKKGAIFLLVPKADGKYYPIRCTRLTVADWLTRKGITEDPELDGDALLNGVIDGKISNGYLQNIIDLLKKLYNSSNTDGDRMAAKMGLHHYFNLDKNNPPIHFNGTTIEFNGTDISSISPRGFISNFFNVLAKNGVQFTIPMEGTVADMPSGRDIITSGVLEVGLKGFYNFNANFLVEPVDENDNVIETEVPSSPEQSGGHVGSNPNFNIYEIGGINYKVGRDPITNEYRVTRVTSSGSEEEVENSDTKNLVIAYYDSQNMTEEQAKDNCRAYVSGINSNSLRSIKDDDLRNKIIDAVVNELYDEEYSFLDTNGEKVVHKIKNKNTTSVKLLKSTRDLNAKINKKIKTITNSISTSKSNAKLQKSVINTDGKERTNGGRKGSKNSGKGRQKSGDEVSSVAPESSSSTNDNTVSISRIKKGKEAINTVSRQDLKNDFERLLWDNKKSAGVKVLYARINEIDSDSLTMDQVGKINEAITSVSKMNKAINDIILEINNEKNCNSDVS